MAKKQPVPLADQVIRELVRNTWEPMHLLVDNKHPLRQEINQKIAAGSDIRRVGGKPENFTVDREGKNEGPYNYTLHFGYRLDRQEPVLDAITLTIDGKSHQEYITDLRRLPSFYSMRERVLSAGAAKLPKNRTIGPDSPSSLRP